MTVRGGLQDDIERSIEMALMNNSITPEAMQTLLNLAEFMEINDMPMHISNLAALAEKSQAYAKALRWKENEFQNAPHSCIDELISINTQLQRSESALGLLTYAAKEYGVKERQSWNEKLGRWAEALKVCVAGFCVSTNPRVVQWLRRSAVGFKDIPIEPGRAALRPDRMMWSGVQSGVESGVERCLRVVLGVYTVFPSTLALEFG